MSDPTRGRVNAAFDDELAATPVPPGLRSLSIRAAVAAPRPRSGQPAVLALVAAILAVALIATLVIGSHALRTTPTPAGSTTPPPARASAAVAYDQAHGVMLVFGGSGEASLGSPARGDTWSWDGKYWTERHPSLSPAPRYYAAMAYDQSRHETVLYGGIGGRTAYRDTWTWDGVTWHQKHPAHEPVFGYGWQAPVMAFDPVSRALLLSGFTDDYKPQAWSWNGTDWQALSAPSAASGGILVFPAGSQLLTVTVEPDLVGGRYVWQTQAWNGSAWSPLQTPFTPALSPIASSAYDVDRRQLVVLSGDTWTWDGTRWARQHPTLQPVSIGYMLYMPRLHEVVSWGDVNSSNNGMYAWDGKDWKLLAESTTPASPGDGGKGGYVGVMTSAEAAVTVRRAVTNTRPVLLPSYVPPSIYDATVNATADDFSIHYQSDLRDREITFGIVVPNPPPGGQNWRETMVKFRNALPTKAAARGYAEYSVSDTKAPESARWLIWVEPGTMTNPPLSGQGVPYFLSASGFTDAEFWQVANSLR